MIGDRQIEVVMQAVKIDADVALQLLYDFMSHVKDNGWRIVREDNQKEMTAAEEIAFARAYVDKHEVKG